MGVDPNRVFEALDEGKIVVVAGFQGITEYGDMVTLGRGGSDTTAVALAGAMKADVCEIFTDVDGVYSTDPRVAKEAFKLEEVTYGEMLEMGTPWCRCNAAACRRNGFPFMVYLFMYVLHLVINQVLLFGGLYCGSK